MNSQSSANCPNCGASNIIFDVEVGLVCVSCGTTEANSSLVSEVPYRSYQENVFRTPVIPHTFPDGAYRGMVKGAEWHLQNELKEYRSLIHNLCTQLEFQGGRRAIYLFELAMAKGDYRWGHDAKLVAAVSVAIAMVEQTKAEAVPRIAGLVHETVSTMLRMWTRVLHTLDMQLFSTSPLLVTEAIYAYLQEALEPPCLLTQTIKNVLLPHKASLHSSMTTAEQLAAFFSQSGDFKGMPAATTACAIWIIAIEVLHKQALPVTCMSSFAKCLGERVGAGTIQTITDRRRAMIIILSEWASLLPWISIPAGALWNHSRSTAVLRAVQDVLWFQNELREVKKHGIDSDSGTGPSENNHTHDLVGMDESAAMDVTMRPSRKRPRGAQQAQRIISQMLDPKSDRTPHIDQVADAEAVQERLARIELRVLFGAGDPLTRLQALSLQRGGEKNVDDDELFEPGELEGYQNSEEVIRSLEEGHPEWNVPIKSDSGNQGKRSKADAIPKDIRYSDDEDGGSIAGLEYIDRDNEGHWVPGREGDDYPLGKNTYLAFGVLADYEGTDPDTARYFGSDMEQA